jgi:CDP-glucose 4,6-dehydratase
VGDVGVDPAFWRGRRVLLTGNTGFKGAWLSLWLLELGAEVSGLAPGPPTEPSLYALAGLAEDVEQDALDVRDAEGVAAAVAARRPEIVIHMAAQPFVRRSFRDPLETYSTNVMGTVHVLDAVRRAPDGVRVVVNVTSDKCYENREWEWGYREDEPMGGFDPYSNSKGISELVTSAYRASFFSDPSGVVLGSARAGNVIGGGDWGEDRLVPDIMRGAAAGAPIDIRRPDAVRPWQHVLNPLAGYLVLAQALWEDPALAGGYNFGPADEDARPVRWIVDRIADRWPQPLDWRIDPGPHPHEATWLKLDSSRARARLGWRPTWALDETLDAIVDWHVRLRDGGAGVARATTVEQIRAFASASAAS